MCMSDKIKIDRSEMQNKYIVKLNVRAQIKQLN